VKRVAIQPEKHWLAHAILAHLIEHPLAEDTVEGIVEWWLLEQEIKYRTAVVRAALADLVAKGLVLERQGNDARLRYGLNRNKLEAIRRLLAQREEGEQ